MTKDDSKLKKIEQMIRDKAINNARDEQKRPAQTGINKLIFEAYITGLEKALEIIRRVKDE